MESDVQICRARWTVARWGNDRQAILGAGDAMCTMLGRLEAKEIFTLQEAAEFIGASDDWLSRYVRNNADLPCRKIGRRWFFTRRNLLEWIEKP